VILGGGLLAQVHDEVEVVPHVVVLLDVPLEATSLSVEGEAVDAADEAGVLHVVLLGEGVRAQLAEGIDDDAEDDVEQDRDHDRPEGELVRHLHVVSK
jgi:hypothetical protein